MNLLFWVTVYFGSGIGEAVEGVGALDASGRLRPQLEGWTELTPQLSGTTALAPQLSGHLNVGPRLVGKVRIYPE